MSGRAQDMKLVILILLGVISWASLLVTAGRQRLQGYTRPMQPPRQEDLIAVGASEEVATQVAAGNKIDAIKVYKDETGTRLHDAKSAVDGLMSRALTRELQANGVSERVAWLLANGNIIGAIKEYREETGTGLREAREYVDTLRQRQ